MVKVTFVDHHGEHRTIEVRPGCSLMEASRRGDIPGIRAECGGLCACATCQVLVDPEWVDRIDPPASDEVAMLEFAAEPASNSRLSCQILVRPELDGLIVRTPARQM